MFNTKIGYGDYIFVRPQLWMKKKGEILWKKCKNASEMRPYSTVQIQYFIVKISKKRFRQEKAIWNIGYSENRRKCYRVDKTWRFIGKSHLVNELETREGEKVYICYWTMVRMKMEQVTQLIL